MNHLLSLVHVEGHVMNTCINCESPMVDLDSFKKYSNLNLIKMTIQFYILSKFYKPDE